MIVQSGKYQCTSCDGLFDGDAGFNDGGRFICRGCYQSRELASAAAAATSPRVARVPAYDGILKGAAVVEGYAGLLFGQAVLCFIVAGFAASSSF